MVYKLYTKCMSYNGFLTNLTLTIIIVGIILIIKSFLSYQSTIKEKNFRLIQFYLDKQFINKLSLDLLSFNRSRHNYLEIADNIKEHFQLHDLLILADDNLSNSPYMFNFKPQVEQFVGKVTQQQIQLEDNIYIKNLESSGSDYILYFYYKFHASHLVVCIQKDLYQLSKEDLETLKTSINLLVLIKGLIPLKN